MCEGLLPALQVDGVHPLASPDDCEDAERICKADPEVCPLPIVLLTSHRRRRASFVIQHIYRKVGGCAAHFRSLFEHCLCTQCWITAVIQSCASSFGASSNTDAGRCICISRILRSAGAAAAGAARHHGHGAGGVRPLERAPGAGGPGRRPHSVLHVPALAPGRQPLCAPDRFHPRRGPHSRPGECRLTVMCPGADGVVHIYLDIPCWC